MWVMRLAVVVAMALGISAEDQQQQEFIDMPDYVKCAYKLFDMMKSRLDTDMESLDGKISGVTNKVRELCMAGARPAIIQQTNEVNGMEQKMATLLQKMEAMDVKLNQMQTKVTPLENMQHLATEQNLKELNASIANMFSMSLIFIQNAVGDSVSVEEIDALLDRKLEGVLNSLSETRRECGSDAKLSEVLSEVLEEVKAVKGDVQEVATATEATKEAAKDCTDEGASHVEEVKTEVEALKEKMQEMDTDFEGKFASLEEMMEEVLNFTRQPPPPPPTPIPTQELPTGPVYPCEDSTFQGSINACQSAVRFNKCHLEPVSFHCCHTCTSQNRLPEMGPWRYLNYNRTVNSLNVIRFFTL